MFPEYWLVMNARLLELAGCIDGHISVGTGDAVAAAATGGDDQEWNQSSQKEYCPLQTRTSLILLIRRELLSFCQIITKPGEAISARCARWPYEYGLR